MQDQGGVLLAGEGKEAFAGEEDAEGELVAQHAGERDSSGVVRPALT